MADVWGSVGQGDADRLAERWLYRYKGQLRGPVQKEEIVERLLRGDLTPDDQVARDGGRDFHSIRKVKTFAPFMGQVAAEAAKRRKKKRRIALLLAVLFALGAIGAAAAWVQQEVGRRQAARDEAARIEEDRLAEEAAARRKLLNQGIETASLLPFLEKDINIQKKTPPRRRRGGTGRRGGAGDSGDDASVSGCQRDQGQIRTVLTKHRAKIGVCINDEKARMGDKMPRTLNLRYVIRPGGEIVEFGILNRELRSGGLNNCLTKAFKIIRFPKAGGSSCPITMPLNVK